MISTEAVAPIVSRARPWRWKASRANSSPGRRQQDAGADVHGHRQRAGLVEQRARHGGIGAQGHGAVEAERVGLEVGCDHGQRAEHDPEVLRDVADVLDRPRRVVAQRRVAVGLELVLVVVARVDEGAGRGERVDEQGRDRQDGARGRGQRAPQTGVAAADEDEPRGGEHQRQPRRGSQPKQEAGDHLRAVERPGRGGAGGSGTTRPGACRRAAPPPWRPLPMASRRRHAGRGAA